MFRFPGWEGYNQKDSTQLPSVQPSSSGGQRSSWADPSSNMPGSQLRGLAAGPAASRGSRPQSWSGAGGSNSWSGRAARSAAAPTSHSYASDAEAAGGDASAAVAAPLAGLVQSHGSSSTHQMPLDMLRQQGSDGCAVGEDSNSPPPSTLRQAGNPVIAGPQPTGRPQPAPVPAHSPICSSVF
jgi:hypothetical protein